MDSRDPFELYSWYGTFADCTPKTIFLDDAPSEFYDYLAQDGIILAGNAPK